MEILARAVGRRKEAVAQVQIVRGSGQIIINNIPASNYLHNNSSSLISMQSPYTIFSQLNINSELSTEILNKTASRPARDSFPNLVIDSATSRRESDKRLNKRVVLISSAILPKSDKGPLGTINKDTIFNEGDINKDSTLLSKNPYDTIVTVRGGGLVGQAEAIKLGIARALCIIFNNNQLDSMTPKGTNLRAFARRDITSLRAFALRDITSLRVVKEEATPINNRPSEATISKLSFARLRKDLLKKELKSKGLLTQDSRVKERRKYGLRKARKASQYHKR